MTVKKSAVRSQRTPSEAARSHVAAPRLARSAPGAFGSMAVDEVLMTADEGLMTVDEGLMTVDEGLMTVDEGVMTVDASVTTADQRAHVSSIERRRRTCHGVGCEQGGREKGGREVGGEARGEAPGRARRELDASSTRARRELDASSAAARTARTLQQAGWSSWPRWLLKWRNATSIDAQTSM